MNDSTVYREEIAKIRTILHAEKPDPMRFLWREGYSATDRDNLLYFAGVDPAARARLCAGQWDDIPAEVREEVRQIARGMDVLTQLEARGRVRVIARGKK